MQLYFFGFILPPSLLKNKRAPPQCLLCALNRPPPRPRRGMLGFSVASAGKFCYA